MAKIKSVRYQGPAAMEVVQGRRFPKNVVVPVSAALVELLRTKQGFQLIEETDEAAPSAPSAS